MKKAADQDPLITAESDFVLKDFRFSDGGFLPELKLHYRTIGQPARNPVTGEIQNAVLLLHGTTSTGKVFLTKGFREAMFQPGQPLRNHSGGLPAGQNCGPQPVLAPHDYHGDPVGP